MKQLIRQLHRRIRPEDQIKRAAQTLTRPIDNPIRSAQIETAATASLRLMRHQLRRLFGEESRLTTERVETKYDRLAGRYLQDQFNAPDTAELVWLQGRLQVANRKDYYAANYDERARWIASWHPTSILEVGAGEWTTLAAILQRLSSPVDAHAIDLSFPRLQRGKAFYERRPDAPTIRASRALAQRLPYRDNSFDLVFTSHCLEHMPLTFPEAIDEALRVARRAVIFFEPSFQRGSLLQKWRMTANGYARGIEDTLRALPNATLHTAQLLDCARPFNRTAVFVLTPTPEPHNAHGPYRVCPDCRGRLQTGPNLWRCHHCQLAFPVVDAIPDLGLDRAYSVASPSDDSAAASHSC